jgi:hypothetical protein
MTIAHGTAANHASGQRFAGGRDAKASRLPAKPRANVRLKKRAGGMAPAVAFDAAADGPRGRGVVLVLTPGMGSKLKPRREFAQINRVRRM